MHIGIAGNIGSGKTTLTRMLAQHYGWTPKFEAVTYNPYLEDYYKDIPRWSFNLEVYFLTQRLKDVMNISKSKEVIIQDPHYANDAAELQRLSDEVTDYAHGHKLMHLPNIIKVFFKYEPDHEIERISEKLENVIEDLSNTRDRIVLGLLGHYPIVSEKAHTRPFEHRWLNIAAAILVPVGIFLYIRMWTFRLRLLKDLRTIKKTNEKITARIEEKGLAKKQETDTLFI